MSIEELLDDLNYGRMRKSKKVVFWLIKSFHVYLVLLNYSGFSIHLKPHTNCLLVLAFFCFSLVECGNLFVVSSLVQYTRNLISFFLSLPLKIQCKKRGRRKGSKNKVNPEVTRKIGDANVHYAHCRHEEVCSF